MNTVNKLLTLTLALTITAPRLQAQPQTPATQSHVTPSRTAGIKEKIAKKVTSLRKSAVLQRVAAVAKKPAAIATTALLILLITYFSCSQKNSLPTPTPVRSKPQPAPGEPATTVHQTDPNAYGTTVFRPGAAKGGAPKRAHRILDLDPLLPEEEKKEREEEFVEKLEKLLNAGPQKKRRKSLTSLFSSPPQAVA